MRVDISRLIAKLGKKEFLLLTLHNMRKYIYNKSVGSTRFELLPVYRINPSSPSTTLSYLRISDLETTLDKIETFPEKEISKFGYNLAPWKERRWKS